MKTMMKILALIMALVMVMCLVACGNDSKNDDGAGTDGTTEPSSTVTVPNGNGGSEDNNSQPADDGRRRDRPGIRTGQDHMEQDPDLSPDDHYGSDPGRARPETFIPQQRNR